MSASQQGSLTPVPKSIGLTDSEFSLTQASTLTFSQNQFTQDTTVSNESPMEVTQDSEQVIEEGDYSRIQINDKRMHKGHLNKGVKVTGSITTETTAATSKDGDQPGGVAFCSSTPSSTTQNMDSGF